MNKGTVKKPTFFSVFFTDKPNGKIISVEGLKGRGQSFFLFNFFLKHLFIFRNLVIFCKKSRRKEGEG